MTTNSDNHSQFELFPSKSSQTQGGSSPFSWKFFRKITLNLEQCVVCCLVLLMVMILAFSLGVERGKKVVQNGDFASENSSLQSGDNGVISNTSESDSAKQKIVVSVDPQGRPINENIEILSIPDLDLEEEVAEPQEIFDNAFTVQVASFKLEKNAKEEAGKLEDKGYEAHVVPKGTYSIVCVGRFSERGQALKLSKELKNKYKDCLVRRL